MLILPFSFLGGVSFLPDTVSLQSAIISNSGTVSDSTLTLVDGLVTAIASIRTKILRLNLNCGNELNAAMTTLYNGDGTTTYGTRYDTPTGLLSAEATATGWDGRAYGPPSYVETGPNGGIDHASWGLVGSGRTPPTQSVVTGLVTNALGSNNFGFGGVTIDNAVSSPLSETNGIGVGIPSTGITTIYGTNTSTKLTARWGNSFSGTDYVSGNAAAGAGFIFTSRTSASETGTRSATTALYLNASQIGTTTGNTSFTNDASALDYMRTKYFAGSRGYAVTKSVTQSEVAILRNAMQAFNDGLQRYNTGRTNAVVIGDSNAAGFGGVHPWWVTTKASSNWSSCRWKVRAYDGLQVGLTSDTISGIAACTPYIDFLKADGTYVTKAIFMIPGGTNDLGASRLATDIWNGTASNGLKAFADARAAAATGNRVVLFTVAPRSDSGWSSGKETQRLALNILIRGSGYPYVDLDLAVGAPDTAYGATVINALYFQADKLHYSELGHAAIGNAVNTNINPATL